MFVTEKRHSDIQGQVRKFILPWLVIGSVAILVAGLQFSGLINHYETYRMFEDEGELITAEVDSSGDTSLSYHFIYEGRSHSGRSNDVSRSVTEQAAQTGTIDLLYIADNNFVSRFVIAEMNTPPGILKIGQMVLFLVAGVVCVGIAIKQWLDARRLNNGFLVEAEVTHVTYLKQEQGTTSSVIQYVFVSPTSGKHLTGEATIGLVGQTPERGKNIAVLYRDDKLYQAL